MRPWAFKVRGGGNATGIKGGPVKAGIQGGVGALCSQDAVFTIATHQDQWIATPPLTDNQYQYSHQMNHPIGKPLRYVSVCSGMEAASVAWHPLGWTPVAFSEIEAFPSAILKHHFSKPNYPYDVPNLGSLTEYQSWPIEPGTIDLLVGGTPCQSFSVAGLRKGLADPRGNLALTFLGLADRLKPKWIVWENVPGVLSSGGGRDFGSFLGALVELGYGFAYRVLDAQHFGVPQRRRRVFVVACLGDWRAAAEVLSLREGLRGYLEAGGKKRKGSAADAGSGVEAGGLHRTVGTLCADTHPGAYSGQDAYTGRLIPATKSDQGVQPYTASSFAQYAEGVGTVRASGGDLGGDLGGGSEMLLAQPVPIQPGNERVEGEAFIVQASELRLRGQITEKDVCPTLTAGAKQGDTDPLAVHAITFQPGNHAVGKPIAFDTYNQAVSNTNQAIGSSASDVNHYGAVFTPPMAVRRLTPVECERLQGFPDNWSRIPWKGKSEEDCPDGPRYKACGNSMAVPVMRWIGERIANYELNNPSQNHEAK